MEKIVIIGAGGHAYSVIDSILSNNKYDIVGILDTNKPIGYNVLGVKVIGNDDMLKQLYNNGVHNAFIAVGTVGSITTKIKVKITKNIKSLGYTIPNIIDPTAIVSNNIIIGSGNYIGKGAVINALVTIGDNTIINTRAVVEHECVIHDYVHVAPNSTLCGNVQIYEYSHIGANAVVIQNIVVNKNVIVGAGSVITKNVEPDSIIYGQKATVRS